MLCRHDSDGKPVIRRTQMHDGRIGAAVAPVTINHSKDEEPRCYLPETQCLKLSVDHARTP